MTGSRVFTRVLLAATLIALWMPAVSADIAAARLEGRPQFSDGDALGYFIWTDGNTWKLRWTTFGAEHRFTGRIAVEGGEFRKFKRVDVDTERKVIAPGRSRRVVRGPRGRVVGVSGGRPAVVASKEEDVMEQESERLIRFATRTDDDLDGLEFEVTPGTVLVRFVLEIDGKPRPQEVEVGRTNFKPQQQPLVVRLK